MIISRPNIVMLSRKPLKTKAALQKRVRSKMFFLRPRLLAKKSMFKSSMNDYSGNFLTTLCILHFHSHMPKAQDIQGWRTCLFKIITKIPVYR